MGSDPGDDRCAGLSEAAEAELDDLLAGISVGCTSIKQELVRLIEAELGSQPCLTRKVLLGELHSHLQRISNRDLIFRNLRRILDHY